MTDRAVMLSIKPKYCELIASGKKTIEVRKTRPKITTPFKCYIYCTKPKIITKYVFKPEDYPEYMRPEKTVFCKVPDASSPFCSPVNGNSKVIGEFVCDYISMNIKRYNQDGVPAYWTLLNGSCLTADELDDYGKGKPLYGLHISNLKIYDTPKELSEFCFPPERYCEKGLCGGCPYDQVPNEYGEYEFDCEWKRPIIRPPQSWCYVEDRK